MSFSDLPQTAAEFKTWEWPQIEPFFNDLLARQLRDGDLNRWLSDWTRLAELIEESYWRLFVATTLDTGDEQAQRQFSRFIDLTQPFARAAEQKLKEQLLKSELEPPGFEIALRNMKTEADLFREVNLPLLAEEKTLGAGYQKIRSAQLVEWDGSKLTLPQLQPYILDPDRGTRERAWRLAMQRRLQDRDALNALWQRFLRTRQQLARNAGQPDYLAYRWRQLLRFAYSPRDCETFHRAIEEVVVPAASRIFQQRRLRLGVESIRPWDAGWDISVDASGQPPLKPFQRTDELIAKVGALFRRLDPALGNHYDLMVRDGALDLDSRPGKMPGAYCTTYSAARQPFIFMNAAGIHLDLLTLIHECGHAFHWIESYSQPYFQNRGLDFQPIEFVEVASTTMEFLTAPYYTHPEIALYTREEAIRARIEHLETAILFWPHMAVVDAFQHWAYTHPHEGLDPDRCDEQWATLNRRFIPEIDWSGLDEEFKIGWQQKLHIFEAPLYYVEYGLAELGAIQVWRGALRDPQAALARYRRALALGSTVALPELFTSVGARFAFDAQTLGDAVGVVMTAIDELADGSLASLPQT